MSIMSDSYPGNLVVHAREAKIHPVGKGAAPDQKDALNSDLWAALSGGDAHFGLGLLVWSRHWVVLL
jgi:hypothetical protein